MRYSMEPTNEGTELVEQWVRDINSLNEANKKVAECTQRVRESEKALATWLCPEDAIPGEKFCVCYGDSLIQIHVIAQGVFNVRLRKRGVSVECVPLVQKEL